MASHNRDTSSPNSGIVNTTVVPARVRWTVISGEAEDVRVGNAIGTNTAIQFLFVIQAQLAALHLALHQFLPLLVIWLHDHLPRISLLEGLLVSASLHRYHSVIREAILSLSVHHLVGAKPMAHLVQVVVVVLEEVAVVCT